MPADRPPSPEPLRAAEPQHPTLLLGLGSFGREVAKAAFAEEARRGKNLVVLDDDEPAAVVAAAKQALRSLLDLSHFVAPTDATAARGPRCDALLIGDLGDASTCERAPALATALAAELRRELPNIFLTGEGALCVVPMLAIPRAADASLVAKAL